jgi:glycosyltransferase involved in cell wall biosynthesis
MKSPLVTITIPTFNSAETIERCLSAIESQKYKNLEVIIIDGGSKDSTVAVAKKYGVICKIFPGSLLSARYEGVKMANGKYTLIFDSDQILGKDAIKNAVEMAERNRVDMFVFEEDVYSKKTFIEKLFACDRKLINSVNDLSPFTGTIMPRFFNTKFLKKAYGNIPSKYFLNTGGPDHAIVYYEAFKLSNKVGIVKDAVKHLEPSSLFLLLKKFYRWGYTSVEAYHGRYGKLMSRKERFRTGLFSKGLIKESVGSIFLLILKGLSFKFGYYIGILDKRLGVVR